MKCVAEQLMQIDSQYIRRRWKKMGLSDWAADKKPKKSTFYPITLMYVLHDDQALDRSSMNAVHALLYGKESSFHWVTLLQSGIITIYPFSVLYFSALLSFSSFFILSKPATFP